MTKNDWIGLSVSIAAHALLLFLMTFLTAATPEMEQLGFVEVELGPFAEGRPVQQAPIENPEAADERPTEELEEPQPEVAAPPEEARPVDLPDQPEEIVDEDVVASPDAETISPERQNNPEDVREEEDDASQPIRPLGSGATDGDVGAEGGEDGDGAEEELSAPFQIEGLDRNALVSPLPTYREKVNATIRVQITVNPQGRIVQRLPLLKGNPALEQSVMDALARWRFNPLPPNAPQEAQTGVVTFHFRLE